MASLRELLPLLEIEPEYRRGAEDGLILKVSRRAAVRRSVPQTPGPDAHALALDLANRRVDNNLVPRKAELLDARLDLVAQVLCQRSVADRVVSPLVCEPSVEHLVDRLADEGGLELCGVERL